MQRDYQTVADPKTRGRKEWSQSGDHERQMEARDQHARQFDKPRKRVYSVRREEAALQIRELRARY